MTYLCTLRGINFLEIKLRNHCEKQCQIINWLNFEFLRLFSKIYECDSLGQSTQTPTKNLKKWFSKNGYSEIGAKLVSLQMVFNFLKPNLIFKIQRVKNSENSTLLWPFKRAWFEWKKKQIFRKWANNSNRTEIRFDRPCPKPYVAFKLCSLHLFRLIFWLFGQFENAFLSSVD